LYVFDKSFFFKEDIDLNKLRKERTIIEGKARKEFPNDDDALEKAYTEFHMRLFQSNEFVIYTEKKATNFCPYCRAVVTSIVVFPFTVLYRLIPKRKPRAYNYEESKKRIERRSKIIRCVCGSINLALGIKHIVLDNSIELAIIQFALGIGLIFLNQTVMLFRKIYNSIYFCYKEIKKLLINLNILKVKTKKIPKPKESKTPNFIQAFFSENHNKYCPPVTFVDKNDAETRV